MLLSALPILTSDGDGPIAGTLVFGRFLSPDRVDYISQRATANVEIRSLTDARTDEGLARLIEELSASAVSGRVESDTNSITHSELLDDVSGQSAVLLRVASPRTISVIGEKTIRTAMYFLLVASALSVLVALFFMQRTIAGPLTALTGQILKIRSSGNLKFGLKSSRADEVGLLTNEFGRMTESLSQAQHDLLRARDEALALSKTKSEFLARMSHEIRTPMNGVLGMSELLQDTVLDSRQQRFVGTIYESAETLLSVINDILDFSKIEAGKMTLDNIEVNLRELLEETMDSLANAAQHKGLELINSVHEDLGQLVQCDPLRLRQIMTNLIGNAIKFTQQGEIIVAVSSKATRSGVVDVRFSVSDTGIGIKAEKQGEIFSSFSQEDESITRNYGGTGLGLSISKQLVEMMGGELSVRSEDGKGSEFYFYLPLEISALSEPAARPAPACIAGKHVLVVDDNATNREILAHQLTGWFANAECAGSADEAMGKLTIAEQQGGNVPDLIILDMHMPRRDGLDLAQSIRDVPAFDATRLIILSSVAMPASDETLRGLNIIGQLTKPIRQAHLYDALTAALSGRYVHGDSTRSSESGRALAGRILLVEDNPVNQAVALGMLESFGIEVVIANNGKDGVREASAQSFDVILMDCQMPVMDGFIATASIREDEAVRGTVRTPIVALTANAIKGDRERCLAAGMDDYLTKPFTAERLHAALAQILPHGRAVSNDNKTALKPADDSASVNVIKSHLDRDVLAVICGLQQPGAPSILQKIVDIYLQNSAGLLQALRRAVANDDAKSVMETAHALKSSSGNVGATSLTDICRILEKSGRNEDLNGADALLLDFEREYQGVTAALRAECAREAA